MEELIQLKNKTLSNNKKDDNIDIKDKKYINDSTVIKNENEASKEYNNSERNKIIQNNYTINNETKKIGIAFVYSTIYSNGIARFMTVTANNLMKKGKYDIYFITGQKASKEYTYNSKIKRFIGYNNFTLIRQLAKT